MTTFDFDKLIDFITSKTGIIPRESHKMGIKSYVERKTEDLEITFSKYFNLISSNNAEFDELINESTVNETYFFREEKQFSFLKEKIFSEWAEKHPNEIIKIWSAACSYGEEAYSLALLAKDCKIKAFISASDINTKALNHCKNGKFKENSKRIGDGESFHHLLKDYFNDGYYEFSNEIKSMINTLNLNLSNLEKSTYVPKRQNLIFIRNVFIYFSRELREKILKYIADFCLSDDGYIFVSMNEIAQIDSEITPDCLEKICIGNVFCFHKKGKSL